VTGTNVSFPEVKEKVIRFLRCLGITGTQSNYQISIYTFGKPRDHL